MINRHQRSEIEPSIKTVLSISTNGLDDSWLPLEALINYDHEFVCLWIPFGRPFNLRTSCQTVLLEEITVEGQSLGERLRILLNPFSC